MRGNGHTQGLLLLIIFSLCPPPPAPLPLSVSDAAEGDSLYSRKAESEASDHVSDQVAKAETSVQMRTELQQKVILYHTSTVFFWRNCISKIVFKLLTFV